MRVRSLVFWELFCCWNGRVRSGIYAKYSKSRELLLHAIQPGVDHIIAGLSLKGGRRVANLINHWMESQGDFRAMPASTGLRFPANRNSPCPAGCNVKASGICLPQWFLISVETLSPS